MPSTAVDLGNSSATNIGHDDSCCANHILFDDWFFFSINECNPSQFGGGGSLKTNYTNFLKGTTPLANSSCQPVAGDAALVQASSSQADSLFSQNVAPVDKGMFNVNFTSTSAWNALLGHARGQQVPQYGAGTISLNPKADYSATRYSVAGDMRADSDSQGASGSSAHGMPGWVRQADILLPLAPILTARDDTFVVRSYGDARDATGKVTARAYCEAVVRRTPNFCDSADAASDTPTAMVNMDVWAKV